MRPSTLAEAYDLIISGEPPERFADDGMREYLTFASPAEFRSRNIFTQERPLRRARSGLARG